MNGWAKDLPSSARAFLDLYASEPAPHCELLVTADGRHWAYNFQQDSWTHGFDCWPADQREAMEAVHGPASEVRL